MKNSNNPQTSKKMKKEKIKKNSADTAKRMLVASVRMSVHRYCALQHRVNILLKTMPMPTKHPKKAKDCPICSLRKLFIKMHECQAVTSEACKTMELLFNHSIDVDAITDEIMVKKYGAKSRYSKEDRPDIEFELDNGEDNIIVPENTPKEVRDVCDKLVEGLARKGFKGAKVEVINMNDDNFGLKQEDFEDFGAFAKALSNKRKEAKEKPVEALNEVIIKKAEEAAKSEAPADKKLN